jgi:hypothetical protein
VAASEPVTRAAGCWQAVQEEQELQQPTEQVKAGLKQDTKLKQEKSQRAAGQKRARLAGEAGAAATKMRA